MEAGRAGLSRRTFGALAMSVLPAAKSAAADGDHRRAQFARDVARSYERQYVAIDLQDVDGVFQGMRRPVLGVGVATGPHRAVLAAQAALRDAGRVGDQTLVMIAFRPGQWRLREYTRVLRTVGARLDAGATAIYGVCDDETLPDGSVRVSVLTG
jgi:cell division GTPase FtsZ